MPISLSKKSRKTQLKKVTFDLVDFIPTLIFCLISSNTLDFVCIWIMSTLIEQFNVYLFPAHVDLNRTQCLCNSS